MVNLVWIVIAFVSLTLTVITAFYAYFRGRNKQDSFSLIEHIREGIILVDKDDNYLSSNLSAVKILPGIAKLVKKESIFSADGWPEELKDLTTDEAEFSCVGKGTMYFRATISPVHGKCETIIAKVIVIREITDTVTLMRELENAAYMDSLTSLYNRKHFSELANVDIERAIRLNQSVFTAMMDLDFFKKINDTYGHAAGDMVLKTTAQIVRHTIRSYDLVGRYGGEEFALLIADFDVLEAYKLMERIRKNMERSAIVYEGIEINITCSIGLAELLETDNLDTALKKADEALYAAKNAGRNQVKVYGAMATEDL